MRVFIRRRGPTLRIQVWQIRIKGPYWLLARSFPSRVSLVFKLNASLHRISCKLPLKLLQLLSWLLLILLFPVLVESVLAELVLVVFELFQVLLLVLLLVHEPSSRGQRVFSFHPISTDRVRRLREVVEELSWVCELAPRVVVTRSSGAVETHRLPLQLYFLDAFVDSCIDLDRYRRIFMFFWYIHVRVVLGNFL